MQNVKLNILFAFLILLLVIHFAFVPLNIIKDLPLNGYYEKPTTTAFSLENYFTRSYQDSTEKSINYSFGLFPGFTRIHHQLEYSLFGRIFVKDVSKGQNGYLFRYCKGCLTDKKFDPHGLDQYLEKYVQFRDSLKKAGKEVIWIITPDKNIIFSEFLSVPHPVEINGYYWDLKKAFVKKNIPFLDLNALAYKEKNKFPFAVMNKGGVHWTQPYAARCFDSVCNYLSATTAIAIKNKIECKSTRNPWDPDYDIEQSANLLKPLEGKENCYFSEVTPITPAKNKKVLLVGDSFCHAWMWNNWMKNSFKAESEFWYYNREASNMDNILIKKLDHKNVRKDIEQFDIFILMFSAANIELLDYGFLNDLDYPVNRK